MILDDVQIRIGVEVGSLNTGTTAPRKFITDRLKVMLKDFLDTDKEMHVMIQVEKNGIKRREYYILNDE